MSFNGIAGLRPGAGDTDYPCPYCARATEADTLGNCQGCGHPKPGMQKIDVTTINSQRREYIWVPL